MSKESSIQTSSAEPSLSQYFADNPPSFFDELAANKKNVDNQIVQNDETSAFTLTLPAFEGNVQSHEYFEEPNNKDSLDNMVSDEVRNAWPIRNELEAEKTTMPGIQTQGDLPDPIREAVEKHLGEQELAERKFLTADSVTQDERGLRQLIFIGCFRSAVNLTGRLLTIYGQGYGRAGQPTKHSFSSLQLWFTRLALLAKLGEYELLALEAEPFGQLDRSDVFYDHYPEMYKKKEGSIACFSFRLLLAELPIYFGDPRQSLDLVSQLYITCKGLVEFYKDDKNAVEFWKRRELRVLHSVINCCINMKRYKLIDNIIQDKILSRPELSKEERRSMYSAWGRIYLQIGDIFGAEQKFAEARRLKENSNSTPDLRDLVDKGLITVAKNDFQEAYITFQKALHIEPGNTMILNNMGSCLLYAGKLKDAITLFERAINLNPQKSLNESLLVNLSTLYELESNNSMNKKLNLLRLINKHKPDINISLEICLKLQSN